MDAIESFEQKSPVQVWLRICASRMFAPLFTIMERLFAISASQAACERALWHLRRILLPFSVSTRPALALAQLQGLIYVNQSNDAKQMRDLTLWSIKSQKSYHFLVDPGEMIRDVKNILEEKYCISTREILPSKPQGEVLDDEQLIGEFDLLPVSRVRDK
jgi:hypothetical protein